MTVVGIVGAGTMGAGIAQVALQGGATVWLHDVDPAAVERARGRIGAGLRRSAAKVEPDAPASDALVDGHLARLRAAATLDELGSADLVIEAAIEALQPKRTIVETLDRILTGDAIIATNTSALSVTAIASAARHPARVLGLHFFNPVPVMRLVEVVVPAGVDPGVVDRASSIVERWGKTPVRCADTPGFIVNRVNRPFTIQALRLLEEGAASVEAIDGALRDAGFPMGPFELMDLTGLDVNLAAATAIWEGLGRPERLRPSPIQERLVADGHLGRKSGIGFYRYVDGRRVDVAPRFAAPTTDGQTTDAPTRAAATRGNAIVERIVGAISDEARRAVAAGVASTAAIDLALRLGTGHTETPRD